MAAETTKYYIISACKDNNPMLRDGITGDWIGTFIGHKGAVWQARLSSDATLAATGSADFSAKVWNTHTGEALHTLQHNHIVRAVAFPNQPRPQILATGGHEKKLRIFDLSRSSNGGSDPSSPTQSNGSTPIPQNNTVDPPSYEIGPGVHQGIIKSIVWSRDLNMIITAADDKKIRWWDLRTRSPIAEVPVDGLIGSCELSLPVASTTSNSSSSTNVGPPGVNGTSGDSPTNGVGGHRGVLSVAAGKTVYFFEGAMPGTLLKSVNMSQEVASVALHCGKRKFVTGDQSGTWVRVFDYDDEKEIEMGKGHHGPIWSVSFSPDGKLYATGSEDGTVKLWKYTQGPYGLWR